MICPRCGRAQPPGAESGVFCVHCGQFLVRTRWVANPPEPPAAGSVAGSAGSAVAESGAGRPRYTGPPAYPSPPRWGFPAQPWQHPETDPDAPPPPPADAAGRAAFLVPLLRGLALLAAVAAAGEIWRYTLLLRSRSEALDAREVAASDALVGAAGWLSAVTSVVAGVCLLLWLGRVFAAAEERFGVRTPRGRRLVLLGWLVPLINLSVPGSVLAEVEHIALGRRPGERVRPSRLLLSWWALWAVNVVVFVVTALWSLRTGVQARADGVELHALLDLLACVTALVTGRVVLWLTALVGPPRPFAMPRLVSVRTPPDRSRAGASTVERP